MVNWRQVSPALAHFKICKLLQYSDENWIWWALVMLSSQGSICCICHSFTRAAEKKNTSLLGLSKAASGKQLFWKGNDWNHSEFCCTEQKWDTIEIEMVWKDWGRLVFLTEPPPRFPTQVLTAPSDTKMAQSCTWEKRAEINFTESQASMFSQAKHYKCIV